MDQSALFEHRFWLQILGDHSRFIFNTLSPKETADIQTAQHFIQAFDQLLNQARDIESDAQLGTLNKQAYSLTVNLRQFKLNILERQLVKQITIGLTPTFLNHMVNELEEYLRILNCLLEGKPVPQFDALHHDFLWLSDAAAHAAIISSDLDFVEKRLIDRSRAFEGHFQQFYLKSIEMAGYMRTELRDFPAFRRFHTDVDMEMNIFRAFLKELEDLELSAEVLDRISPLIPDHMMREECYYLMKLAQLGLVQDPECTPDKPRIEEKI
ncbi:DUF2935 domain-containing protein [Paenibacillus motobuensis]|uniref:DUF2935 domain-containing protein n=1 Tax=Paenibacillus TaxID=44249 RepID=UPI0020400B32|nr:MULTISPECIES: DUF2935 domain-containing protein [Paenibacillus]MCM3039456.1 DUF2935 domain-containing protein [Paenibacillus lutimineralis]MCM3646560.1 DUF2935 domain-containing protein [Paenibacillus motobuensis]